MTKPGSLYWTTRALTRPFRSAWFDLELQGEQNVPVSGPVVLAPNHISFLDSALLMYALPRKVLFLGKAEYTQSWKTSFFPAAGMIPVDRSGKGLMTSMGVVSDLLDEGEAIGVFPEGTRSRDGFIHEGHTGAAYLAQRTGAALVPVGISGTDEIQPPDARFPRRGGKVTFRFGAPLDIASHGAGATARREITEELMHTISALSGRPYIGATSADPAPSPSPRQPAQSAKPS